MCTDFVTDKLFFRNLELNPGSASLQPYQPSAHFAGGLYDWATKTDYNLCFYLFKF